MKIEISLKIILLIILFLFLNKIDTYVIFIVFIFIHELFHMITGIVVGFVPKTMRLTPFGVSIEFYSYSKRGIKESIKKIITYLSGPLVNFLIAIIFYNINIDMSLKIKLVYTNILIGVFNLIPIVPLDGGKIVKEILKNIVGNKKANVYMIKSTKVILIILSLIYSVLILEIRNIAILIILLYLWYLYYMEEKKLSLMLKVYDIVEKEKNN